MNKFKRDLELYDSSNNDDAFLYNYEMKRQSSYKITFDFIPKLQANRNVRSASYLECGTYAAWTEIRNHIEKISDGVCEVCGKTNDERKYFDSEKKTTSKTECHEVWRFIEVKKPQWDRVQKLEKLSPRCFFCHHISHLDQQKNASDKNTLIEAYTEYNGITLEQAEKDYNYAIELRDKNENYKFKLEMSLINKLNLTCHFYDDLYDCHTARFDNFLYDTFLSKDEE